MAKAHFPYGVSDFKTVSEEGYVYVDRTRFLEHLEQLSTRYHAFLRPAASWPTRPSPAKAISWAGCWRCAATRW